MVKRRRQKINRRAWLGSEIVRLKGRITELEKLARKTPPKTLLSERVRVEQAKTLLAETRALLADCEREYASLLDELKPTD